MHSYLGFSWEVPQGSVEPAERPEQACWGGQPHPRRLRAEQEKAGGRECRPAQTATGMRA